MCGIRGDKRVFEFCQKHCAKIYSNQFKTLPTHNTRMLKCNITIIYVENKEKKYYAINSYMEIHSEIPDGAKNIREKKSNISNKKKIPYKIVVRIQYFVCVYTRKTNTIRCRPSYLMFNNTIIRILLKFQKPRT